MNQLSKLVLLLLFFCCPLFSYAYELTGKIEFDNKTVKTITVKFLYYDEAYNRIFQFDTATITGNTFKIQGKIPNNYDYFSATLQINDLYVGSIILNNKTNKITVSSKNNIISPENITISIPQKTPVDSLRSERSKHYKALNEKSKKRIDLDRRYDNDLIKNNPANYYSLMLLDQLAHSVEYVEYPDSILALYKYLTPEIQNTKFGKKVYTETFGRSQAASSIKTGKPLPYFEVKDENDKLFKSSSLNGSVSLVVFSAVWCSPCQVELKHLIVLYNTYKDKGFKVVYFNLDDNKNKWLNHIQKNNLTWTNVSEMLPDKSIGSVIAKQFLIYAVPASFLIDKNGIILKRMDGIMNAAEQKQIEQMIVNSL